MGQCLTSSRAGNSKIRSNRPKLGPNEVLPAFSVLLLYQKRKDFIKLIFHFNWLHRISFIYNHTNSFFRYKIVKWPWIEFKMRPMLFKESWNLFYSNVVECPVKLACFQFTLGLVKFGYFYTANRWEFCIDSISYRDYTATCSTILNLYNHIRVTVTLWK